MSRNAYVLYTLYEIENHLLLLSLKSCLSIGLQMSMSLMKVKKQELCSLLQIQNFMWTESASKRFPDRSPMEVPTALTVLLCLDQQVRSNYLHCVRFTLDTSFIFYFQMYTHLCCYPLFLLLKGLPLMPPLREHL